MQLKRNFRRQAELAAILVNLALPGWRGSRRYDGLDPAELIERFSSNLSVAVAASLGGVPDGGARLSAIAEALRSVFETSTDADTAERLNELMRRYRARPYLIDDVGQPFHLHFHGDAETAIESLAGELATSLALLMDGYGQRRFGVCEATDCDRVYVDTTRNGARRYCSDGCSARAKMAAHRARMRKT